MEKSGLAIQIEKQLLAPTGKLFLRLQLNVAAGERVVITGPSGSGKTTLLRMLAGLVRPNAGHIHFNHQVWFESSQKIHWPPQQRPVGLMFQEYALFPNMTVRQNLEYALPRGQSKSIVEELVQMVELGELVQRYPHTLSGGQQQRVALARALVAQPAMLLLDEPLSALDTEMRERLQNYILKVQEKFELTLIWVTHNREEAAKVANRLFLLENGKLAEQPLQNTKIEHSGIIQQVQNIDNQQIVTLVLNSKINDLIPGEELFIKTKKNSKS